MTLSTLCGIPTGGRVVQVDLSHPSGGDTRMPHLGHPLEHSLPLDAVAAPSCKVLRQGADFPWVFRRFVYSPCTLLAKPGVLAACLAPHRYLSGAAVSPPVCIRWPLRPKGSMPASYRHGDFPSIPSLRFVAHSASFPTGGKGIMTRAPYRCAVGLMIKTDEVSGLCGSCVRPPLAHARWIYVLATIWINIDNK